MADGESTNDESTNADRARTRPRIGSQSITHQPTGPMSAPPLTDDQRGLLEALVERHAEDPGPVKRTTLAAAIGCHPVTVSVWMQNLRAQQLVESTSGPRGGYEPTLKARDRLANRDTEAPVDVPITSDGEHVDGVRIRGLALLDLHSSRGSRGRVALDGPITELALNDAVSIGPLPGSGLHIDGVVQDRDPEASVIVLAIDTVYTATDDHTSTHHGEDTERA